MRCKKCRKCHCYRKFSRGEVRHYWISMLWKLIFDCVVYTYFNTFLCWIQRCKKIKVMYISETCLTLHKSWTIILGKSQSVYSSFFTFTKNRFKRKHKSEEQSLSLRLSKTVLESKVQLVNPDFFANITVYQDKMRLIQKSKKLFCIRKV